MLEALPPRLRAIATALKRSELNRRDFANMERGYYENLVNVGVFSPELLEVYRTRPADWVFGVDNEAFRPVDYNARVRTQRTIGMSIFAVSGQFRFHQSE